MVKNLPAKPQTACSAGDLVLVRKIPWRRKWQLTPVFLPGKFHGLRSLAATVHGLTKSDTTEHAYLGTLHKKLFPWTSVPGPGSASYYTV